MGTNPRTDTAKIYRFPVGGRRGLAGRDAGGKPEGVKAPVQACDAADGSGWYHEAAMRDGEGAPRN